MWWVFTLLVCKLISWSENPSHSYIMPIEDTTVFVVFAVSAGSAVSILTRH